MLRSSLIFVLSAAAIAQSPRFQVLNEQFPAQAPQIYGVVDFDLDGDADLITDGFIAVNDGSGIFSAGPTLGGNPCCVFGNGYGAAIGDLNGDALPDAVRYGLNWGQPEVLLNNGALGLIQGAFLPNFGPVGTVQAAAVGDVDGDGDRDLVLVAAPNWPTPATPHLLLNNGAAIFTESTATTLLVTGPPGDQVEMRDFDLDGDLDIFVWSGPWGGSGAGILVNNGVGVFNQVVTVPAPGSGAPAAIGDFNGDGLPDVAWGTVGSPTSTDGVTLNTGSMTFAPFVPTVQATSAHVVALDLDGDGIDEIVRSFYPTVTVHHVLAGGIIGPATQTLASQGGWGWARDLDGDGDRDLVLVSSILMSNGAGMLIQLQGDVAPPYLGLAVLGDVDGDGDVDSVACGSVVGATSPFSVNTNDGFGNFAPGTIGGILGVTGQAQHLFGIALDGDGDLDLFVGHPSNTIYRNVGATFVPIGTVPPFTAAALTTSVASGDLDGDGDIDLVFGRSSGGPGPPQSPVLLNQGAAGFGPPVPLPVGHYTYGVVLFDADGDGDLDIAQANLSLNLADSSVIFLNDGLGGFTQAPGSAFPAGFGLSIVAGDLDGDGDQDLVLDGQVFLNNGAGIFTPGVIFTTVQKILDAFDADGDGDVDLLAYTSSAGTLFLNQGNATFPTTEPVPLIASNQYRIGRADVDFDGDQDLVGNGRLLSNTTRQIARGMPTAPGRFTSLKLFGPPGAPFDLYVSAGTTHLPVPPYGTVLIDPATALHAMSGVFSPAGTATFSGFVPNNPALIGLTVYWQAGLPVQQRLTNLEVMAVLGL